MDLIEPFTADEYGTVTIGKWGGWLVQVTPMFFGDRLVLTPENCPLVYDFGWCFPKGPAAYAAARAWDPETEADPPGYTKRATGARRAGQKADEGSPGREYAEFLGAVLGVDLLGE